MSKTAVVLAGGFGRRLGSFTEHLPKPLLPINGIPLLEIILRQLVKNGFKRVILAIHYKSDLIKFFCGDGSKWNLTIEYSEEEKQLGTIGPIKLISTLPEDFLIMNSDVLTDMNLNLLYERHVDTGELFTLACYEQFEEIQYGLLEIENERLVGFKEKPVLKQSLNMGIYMANRKILEYIPDDTFFGLNDLILKLLVSKQSIAAFPHRGKWMDVGTLQNYDLAQSVGFP